MSCVAKEPKGTLLSSSQESSLSLTASSRSSYKALWWLSMLILQRTKEYKQQIIVLASSGSFLVS